MAEVTLVWVSLLLLTVAKIDSLARDLPQKLPFPLSFYAKLGLLPLRAWTFIPAKINEVVLRASESAEEPRSEERPARSRLEAVDSAYFGSDTASLGPVTTTLDVTKVHEEVEELIRRNEALVSK